MGAPSAVCVLSLLVACISTLPLRTEIDDLPNIMLPQTMTSESHGPSSVKPTELQAISDKTSEVEARDSSNATRADSVFRNSIRPGMVVNSYSVDIAVGGDGETFSGRAVLQVTVTDRDTLYDPVVLHASGLDVSGVQFSVGGGDGLRPAAFSLADDLLEIFTDVPVTIYTFIIEYTGIVDSGSHGIFAANHLDYSYMGMNLHPSHARRVFPCLDEPGELTTIMFTFHDVPHATIVLNSLPEENSPTEFRALQGPAHLWGMVAHDLPAVASMPAANIELYGRRLNQDLHAASAIQFYYNELLEFTGKPYFEIVHNQNDKMVILALPDTDTDWYALSTVPIWEPYIYMESVHSMEHKKIALLKIAEAMSRQWFGYVIYPEVWNSQWVISGLSTYAAYDIFKSFQSDLNGVDISLLDVDAMFLADVVQESLSRDAYASALPLEPLDELLDEPVVRAHVAGLQRLKAPAVLRMLRHVLADDDYVRLAARALLNSRSLLPVSSLNFYDALTGQYMFAPAQTIEDIPMFLEPWLTSRGYPLIHVGLRQGGLIVTQEQFGFTAESQVNFEIPLTYSISSNPNFDSLRPVLMMDNTVTIPMALDEEDYVLFNNQGQGYYRVNYDMDLWERIMEALNDPEQRANIHPSNRATLLDDALNLARAGKLDYSVGLEVALAMQHETEYAPWRAFIRSMDFLRRWLEARVQDHEDLDPDIYLRMVRRAVVGVEAELGWYPEPLPLLQSEPAMWSLTRGLVMKHACRARHGPCLAAALDWFYDPNANEPVVNPNIPHDLRPAVYCSMVSEGDDLAMEALYARLDVEVSAYERLVILESLACSRDAGFITNLLTETIATGSPYGVEERARIFAAVAGSSYDNARLAMSFMQMRTNEIRNSYGGPRKLEQLIDVLVDNMAAVGLATDFRVWVTSINSNLQDSEQFAESALARLDEHLAWEEAHLDFVYEWIDENDASALTTSTALLVVVWLVHYLLLHR